MNSNDKIEKPYEIKVMIYDRRDFPSADAKFLALVEDGEKDIRLQNHLSDYTGPWDLSYIEAEIFDIDPDLLPALSCAYERYENLIGLTDLCFGEFREQERIDHAKFYQGECVNEMPFAVDFMVQVCGLPALQCFGWVMKIHSAALRGGLFTERQSVDQ